MKMQPLLFSLLLLSTSIVYAESPSNIIDIYQKAVEKDATLAAERAAAKVGQEKETQGLSGLLPSVNASANVNYNYSRMSYSNSLPDSSKIYDSSGINLQLTQPLFRLARRTAYSQSKIAVELADVQLLAAEQNLILRVAKAYFDALSANESYTVAQSQTIAFNENLERAKLTFKVGTATKTDKLEAQARYDLARASELSALNQQAIARQSIASIIGETPRILQALSKKAALLKVDPQDMQHWVDAAIANNLSLRLSQFSVQNANLEIKKLKDDRLPVVDFVALAGLSNQYISQLDADSTNKSMSIGLQLSMPLYTGGLMSSRIREAEALHMQQKYSSTDVQRQIVLQTQQFYLTALNGFQQVEALKQASISSESALEATRKGMEVGVRTNLDLLNAQQQFFETERDYTVAKYNYLLTVLNLKAAAGSLANADINGLNQLLEN